MGSQMLFQKKVSMSCDGGEAADFARRQRTTRLLRRGDAQGTEEQDAVTRSGPRSFNSTDRGKRLRKHKGNDQAQATVTKLA